MNLTFGDEHLQPTARKGGHSLGKCCIQSFGRGSVFDHDFEGTSREGRCDFEFIDIVDGQVGCLKLGFILDPGNDTRWLVGNFAAQRLDFLFSKVNALIWPNC